jgi:ABC-type antimicrobial peptide transport system permease subunit
MTLVVRARSVNPEALVPAIRSVMNDLDRSVPLGSVTTMTDVVERSMGRTAIVMLLLAIAAVLALLLGALGLYGLLAYTVSSRQREIGIRAALGCGRGDLARLIVWHALTLTGIGGLAGVAAAAATTRVLENLLFGISAMDPATLGAACLLLVLTAFVASYVPARRAATVDPVVVLRAE